MKIPFFNRKKKRQLLIPNSKPLEQSVVRSIRASAFFLNTSEKEKDQLFQEVMQEVNQEQKKVVEEFGQASV